MNSKHRRGFDCRKCGQELNEQNADPHHSGICRTCRKESARIAERQRYARINKIPGYVDDLPKVQQDNLWEKPVGFYFQERKNTKSASSNIFLDPNEMRVACFDIETSGLQADAAIVLCATVKTYGTDEPPETFRIDLDEIDLLESEKNLVEEVCECLRDDYEGLIGYYSSKFDLPFLRVRSYLHKTPQIPKTKMLDLYFTAKRTCLPMGSKRLARINDLLRYKRPHMIDKTDVEMFRWIACVMSHDESALDEICEHNIADVIVLENDTREFQMFVPDQIKRY